MGISFKPCINRNACSDDGVRCRSCGRSLDEIVKTREIVDTVFNFILEMEYDNSEDFIDYLGRKIARKIKHATQ